MDTALIVTQTVAIAAVVGAVGHSRFPCVMSCRAMTRNNDGRKVPVHILLADGLRPGRGTILLKRYGNS